MILSHQKRGMRELPQLLFHEFDTVGERNKKFNKKRWKKWQKKGKKKEKEKEKEKREREKRRKRKEKRERERDTKVRRVAMWSSTTFEVSRKLQWAPQEFYFLFF